MNKFASKKELNDLLSAKTLNIGMLEVYILENFEEDYDDFLINAENKESALLFVKNRIIPRFNSFLEQDLDC